VKTGKITATEKNKGGGGGNNGGNLVKKDPRNPKEKGRKKVNPGSSPRARRSFKGVRNKKQPKDKKTKRKKLKRIQLDQKKSAL